MKSTQCEYCMETKIDTSQVWIGSVCPTCIIWEKEQVAFEKNKAPLSNRHCTNCFVSLPTSRYFKCSSCEEDILDNGSDTWYEGEGFDIFTIKVAESLSLEENKDEAYSSEEIDEGSNPTDEKSHA